MLYLVPLDEEVSEEDFGGVPNVDDLIRHKSRNMTYRATRCEPRDAEGLLYDVHLVATRLE